MWGSIAERLEKEGYKQIYRDDEAKVAINQHSEKLAVAFRLLRTKPGTAIRTVKNLRICEDRHTVAKLVSKIYDRDIVMRDRTRFHHFKHDKCTCGDKWGARRDHHIPH
ncbi:hypothetical protein GQ457_02G007220 [Hibiscus cannabinus]